MKPQATDFSPLSSLMTTTVEAAAATAQKLAILQAYPAGTEVEYTEYQLAADAANDKRLHKTSQVLSRQRGVLIGYTHDSSEKVGHPQTRVGISLYSDRAVWRWVGLEEVQLVLRPFSALCTPLSDGTGRVPVIEAAKTIPFEDEINWATARAHIYRPRPDSEPSYQNISLVLPVKDENGCHCISIDSDWVVRAGSAKWPRYFLNGLIAQHAAVGLSSRDYLPK
jgi:hypothetical protein